MTSGRARGRLISALACAAAGFFLFWFRGNATHGYIATNSLFYWWGFQWVNPDSETEHAWLVLALSLFILWKNIARSGRSTAPANTAAGAALIGGLLVHCLGFIAQQPRISILGLLLYAWGILALAGGRRWARASAFPVGFMVFAIPVNALDTIGFWLRMWVVEAGERIAHLMGIGVLRNGTQLAAPDGRYFYDVAAACSGVRSLMALAALSLVIGYLWLRPAWLRAAMLLVSLPLIYVGNVIRIVSIILAAQWGGQAWGNRIHDAMGFGVFIVVLGGVVAIAEFVCRKYPALAAPAAPQALTESTRSGLPSSAVAILVVVGAVAAGSYLSLRASRPQEPTAGIFLTADGINPVELPPFLGSDWMGKGVPASAIEKTILPPDTGYSRKLYFSREGPSQQVLLSIVLSGRDRTSIHRPELCLVAQGYTIEGSSFHRFEYPGRPDSGFPATLLHVRHAIAGTGGKLSEPEIIVYWFVGQDRVVASQGARMLYDAWNRVAHGRADRWAYVLLQARAQDGEAATLGRIQSVLNSALPAFQPAVEVGRAIVAVK